MNLKPTTINRINSLSPSEKRQIYQRLVPRQLLENLHILPDLHDSSGHDLFQLVGDPGSSFVELELFHQVSFPDPVLHGLITDTLNGQLHIIEYVINDPMSPRFDIDRTPDGQPTHYGTENRNLVAELAALQFGLAPGQIRRGLRSLQSAIQTFEQFVTDLGQELFFSEPLYYHNAILFERYGFGYQKGRRLMERLHDGFSPGGELLPLLNNSTPFRKPEAADSIRLRSWAIHDDLLGMPFTDVTMYKWVGKSTNLDTSQGCAW